MYRIEDNPQIKDNFFLEARNLGASRKLRGDIEIIICFMKKRPTDFTEFARAQFTEELYKACDWLKSEAERYGTKLTFKYRFFKIDTPADAQYTEVYDLIKNFFNSQAMSMDQLQSRYEKMSGSDESPFILVFDEKARSYAQKQSAQRIARQETSIVYKERDNLFHWTTIAHELLHQFGAMDFYYPREVVECARRYIKDSIMGVGAPNILDDLTAYLVGIKDTISADTYYFLKETMWIDYDLYCKHVTEAWKTGTTK